MRVRAVKDDMSPVAWDFTRTRGDMMVPTRFDEITFDGSPLVITSVLAQVRRRRDRDSELVLDLDAQHAAGVVTVGDGVSVDVPPGTYWWDLQVNDLTMVGGTFRVLGDVSHEEVAP